MASFEISGILHKKGEKQQITESFAKRELVVTIDPDGKYPEYVAFELVQDNCSKLDPFNEGDVVKVSFNLKGREWSNKYFVNLRAWKIESESNNQTQAKEPETPKVAVKDDGGNSDLPF